MSAAQPSTTGLAVGEADEGGHHGLSSMAILCTVMLAAAAGAALLLVGAHRAPRIWSHVSTIDRATVCPGSTVACRGTGLPPAWEFSVIRC